jgi:sulfopropanediol 3-dehydrogenase
MKTCKEGHHRLFENDPEITQIVSAMLSDLEKHGINAVRRYSRQFDDWNPPSFELTPAQIECATARLTAQAVQDTAYCQDNIRGFARAQLETMRPLEIELCPGVIEDAMHYS